MFSLDEKLVYPGHGVAKVASIVEKNVSGKLVNFYELKFINKDVTILVPVDNVEAIGLRALSSQDNIEKEVFSFLAHPAKKINASEFLTTNWNKKNKDYQSRLRTGKLRSLSEIYSDLKHIEQKKGLSFGERNLLNQVEALLAEEIAIVKDLGKEKVLEQLRSFFNVMRNSVGNYHNNV